MAHDADTIVIGSGAGGLAAAVAMARAGEKVLVLEQHYVPGGWCHSFTLEDFRFSPGVHYIGQLGEGQPMRRIYEGLGVADDLIFFELNPDGFDHCRIGDDRFDYPRGKEAIGERLARKFPAEARGIVGFLELVERVSDQLGALSDIENVWDILAAPWRARHLGRFGLQSTDRVMNRFIEDPRLRGFLTIQCGDYGLPPARAPFAMHAAVAGHYFNGGWYPRGGGASLPRAFIRELKRNGGAIELEAPVDRILIEGGRAAGVRMADGRELRAKRIISNADPHVTFEKLVGREHLSRGLVKKLDKTTYSISSLSLFFAAEIDAAELGLDSGNYWHARDDDFNAAYEQMLRPDILEAEELPGVFLTVTSLKDPTKFDGKRHTMEAFTFLTYDAFKKWEGTDFEARPDDYAAMKAQLVPKMLRSVERLVPGISERVVFKDLGTPLTNVHYANSTRGSVYGTEKTWKQVGPFAFPLKSEIKGLTLCGASTVGHGIMGATLSGVAAAASLLKVPMKELLRAEGRALRTYPADDISAWPADMKAKLKAA